MLQGCYLSQCGCPPYTSGEEWCGHDNDADPNLDAGYFDPTGYCQAGLRENCDACEGVWCAGVTTPPRPNAPPLPPSVPAPPFSPTLQGCYLAECGCPPFDHGEDWCANANDADARVAAGYFTDVFCQDGSRATCEACAGAWCEGALLPPAPPRPPAPPAPPQGPSSPPVSDWYGGCYAPECGCPLTPAPTASAWCTERNASASALNALKSYWDDQSYCGLSASACEADCGGLYCAGPSMPSPPPSPPSPPPSPSTPPGEWPWQHGYATRYWDCCARLEFECRAQEAPL